MMVDALAGVAAPTSAAENLVSLGTAFGLLEEVSPDWPLLVVMASYGFLGCGWTVSHCAR